jgi:hypothetical protein
MQCTATQRRQISPELANDDRLTVKQYVSHPFVGTVRLFGEGIKAQTFNPRQFKNDQIGERRLAMLGCF